MHVAKKGYAGPAERLEAYEALVARFAGVDRKGAANPYTSRNGWMTSFLDAEGSVSLRLSPDDRERFVAAHPTSGTPVQYGKQMPDFLVVPDELLDDPDALEPWFARSLDWVSTLKPKKTTR